MKNMKSIFRPQLVLVLIALGCSPKAEQAALEALTSTTTTSTTTTTTASSSFALSSISPALTNTLGGITVTLTGTGFASGATVTIGGATCTSVSVVNATTITCVAPALNVGTKDVVVTQSSSTQTLTNGFSVQVLMALASAGSGNILLYSQNSSTGALTLQSTTASSGSSPRGVIFAQGQKIYVFNSGNAKISAYSFNMSNFALTELAGSPYTVTGCTSMKGGVITPDFQYLYASCEGSGQVYVYNIASDGTLSANANGPYSATSARSLRVSADSSMLFVSSYANGDTSLFNINGDGSLTALAGNPYALGGIVTGSAVYDNYFYSPNWGAGAAATAIRQYSYTTSSLAALSPATVAAATDNSYSIEISPDGKWAAVACEAGAGALLNAYSRNTSTGLLTVLGTSPLTTGTDTNLRAAVYDPTSAFVYVVGGGSSVFGYSVNQTTGELTSLAGFPISLGSDGNVYRIDLK